MAIQYHPDDHSNKWLTVLWQVDDAMWNEIVNHDVHPVAILSKECLYSLRNNCTMRGALMHGTADKDEVFVSQLEQILAAAPREQVGSELLESYENTIESLRSLAARVGSAESRRKLQHLAEQYNKVTIRTVYNGAAPTMSASSLSVGLTMTQNCCADVYNTIWVNPFNRSGYPT